MILSPKSLAVKVIFLISLPKIMSILKPTKTDALIFLLSELAAIIWTATKAMVLTMALNLPILLWSLVSIKKPAMSPCYLFPVISKLLLPAPLLAKSMNYTGVITWTATMNKPAPKLYQMKSVKSSISIFSTTPILTGVLSSK